MPFNRGLRITPCGFNAKAQSRQVERSTFLAALQCYIGKLRIFGKIFPPLFSLFAPVQFLWLRLAALGRFAALRWILQKDCGLGEIATGRSRVCRSSASTISGFLFSKFRFHRTLDPTFRRS